MEMGGGRQQQHVNEPKMTRARSAAKAYTEQLWNTTVPM
jgi:hypothetical protein